MPIHILINISRSKDNQAIKPRQLIEYNLRKIFLKNHTHKLFPDPSLKDQNWAYPWISILKFYTFCFYCLPSWGLSKMVETKLLQTSYKAFLKKNKRRSGTSLPAFSAWFLKKNNFVVIFYNLTNSKYLALFTSWDISQYVYCNYLLNRLRRHRFWN